MDIQYRIWLMLRILPFGIAAGIIAAALSYIFEIKKNGKSEITKGFLFKKIILPFAAALYIVFLIGMMFFHSSRLGEISVSLPFAQYWDAMRNGSTYLLLNVLFNLLIFIPVGCFVSLLWDKVNRTSKMFSIALLFSCFMEMIQMFTRKGAFSFDDIICSVTGAMLGFGAVCLLKKKQESVVFVSPDSKKNSHRYAVLLLATVIVFYLSFIHCSVYAASEDIYYTRIEKIYRENKQALSLYADVGNYSYPPDIKNIMDMSYGEDWFQLELDREFNGTDLKYYGLFYMSDDSPTPVNATNTGEIEHSGNGYYYLNENGIHYELKSIENGFFYYMVKY